MHNGSSERREGIAEAARTRTIVFTPAWAGARARWRRDPLPGAPAPESGLEPVDPCPAEPASEVIVACETGPEPLAPCPSEPATGVIVASNLEPVAPCPPEPLQPGPSEPEPEPLAPEAHKPVPQVIVACGEEPKSEPLPEPRRQGEVYGPVAGGEIIVGPGAPITHTRTIAPVVLALIVLLSVVTGGAVVAALDRWGRSTVPAPPGNAAKLAAIRDVLESERAAGRESADRLARIEERLKEKPAYPPAPDLKPIQNELDALRGRLDQVVADGQSLKGLPNVVGGLKADFDKSLAAVQADVKVLLTEERSEARKPVNYAEPAADLYRRGVEEFDRGSIAAADAIFHAAAECDPKDARIWYYLALCTAKITKDWQNAPKEYWQKGVACEREAPESSERVDAAFASLSQVGGKDWVTYYRSPLRRAPGAYPVR